MRRLCNLIGCKWNEEGYCVRCGGDSDYTPMVWYQLIAWKVRFYLHKCTVCGRRFDRHNDDCLPF